MADSRGFVPVSSDRGAALHRSRPRPGRGRRRSAPECAPARIPRAAPHVSRGAIPTRHPTSEQGVETDTAFQECNIRRVRARNPSLGKHLLCLGLPKVKRPLRTIGRSGRLTMVTLPILTRSRPWLSDVRFLLLPVVRRSRSNNPLLIFIATAMQRVFFRCSCDALGA
jgi:hypothetical protein